MVLRPWTLSVRSVLCDLLPTAGAVPGGGGTLALPIGLKEEMGPYSE